MRRAVGRHGYKRVLRLGQVYRHLEPGPVLLVTTASAGRPNVMTLSWHTMLEFEPALVGIVLSDRNYSHAALRRTRECVINIPTAELATAVVKCGNRSGRRLDKFRATGLTAVAASMVAAPLIAECYANFECRVVDTRLAARYCFFVLEVCKAWIDPAVRAPRTLHHRGRGEFTVAGRTLRRPSRKK